MNKILRYIEYFYFWLASGLPIKNLKNIKGRVTIDDKVTISVSPSSKIYSLKVSGTGTVNISENVEIRDLYIHISENGYVHIGRGTFIGHGVKILSHNTLSLGENCLIAPNVVIVDNNHIVNSMPIKDSGIISKELHIGNNVWIGASTVIAMNSFIESDVIVGAGSLVNQKLNRRSIYVGSPVKFIREKD
ncbi:TPA: hypothetical protein ACGUXT_001218 [Vibrio vulnificus]|nr:acyltransferase [Vibrio parahaemolyticus]